MKRAAGTDSENVVRTLLENGVNSNTKYKVDLQTLLPRAASFDLSEVAWLPAECGAELNPKDQRAKLQPC